MAPGGEGSSGRARCARRAQPAMAGFISNPPNKRARGAQRQKRIQPAHLASKG